MSLKLEFAMLADQKEANMSALCRRFDISRPTGYKWLRRYRKGGPDGLKERSRRPTRSPNKTPDPVEELVCEVRRAHPTWGGRKIRARLQSRAEAGTLPFDREKVPAASTCQTILKRNGLVEADPEKRHRAFQRFEKDEPNALWQMDFKGHFPLVDSQQRCHALTVIDDHSRFALGLEACPDERRGTVRGRLTALFRRYGLPRRILCDNSLPWGVPTAGQVGRPLYTKLNRWLFRLGIDVIHGRPYHPETQGKCERFHRSLEEEVLQYGSYKALPECQASFDQWRQVYNLKRPHEALAAPGGMKVPASRYRPSGRPFPSALPSVSYPSSDQVRTVSKRGQIRFAGDQFYVGEAFAGHPVALRTQKSGDLASSGASSGASSEAPSVKKWSVYFCHKRIRVIESKPPDQ